MWTGGRQQCQELPKRQDMQTNETAGRPFDLEEGGKTGYPCAAEHAAMYDEKRKEGLN